MNKKMEKALEKAREIEGFGAFQNWLEDVGFYTAPASTRFHGAYAGGLYKHSENVCEELMRLTEKMGLKWERDNLVSPFLVGMYHDVCKIDNYLFDEERGIYIWNPDAPKGHGERSVQIIDEYFFKLTEEEKLCIRYHMGAYNREDWEGFDQAIKRYPNVLWTHTADMYASKVAEKE